MITRIAQLLLVIAIALFYTLVVLNNLTDFDSNYQFVRHVLMMDTTFPHNHELWRAVQNTDMQRAFYFTIIAWEIVTMLVLWVGSYHLLRRVRGTSQEYEMAKKIPAVGLILSMLMWLVGFLTVGGEYFLMWQSHE